MKKILMHICCAPCFIAPYSHLSKRDELEIFGFWFNPNIHPYTEYYKRKEAVLDFAKKNNIRMIWKDEYNLEDFLRKSAYRENSRCFHCYYDRLKYAAIVAKKGNFDYFSSTLLYSKYQKHELIRSIGEDIAKEQGIKFFYEDYREYWQEGIELSKENGMYRQEYCGCIYSEKDRYEKQLLRKWSKLEQDIT